MNWPPVKPARPETGRRHEAFSLFAEYVDRKLHARLQRRIGPPWFQPLADFIKLAAKEDLIPAQVDSWMFRLTPVVALAATVTALMGKLERVPFDIPEAETEIVAGSFTEYSGRLLALFRLTIDIEMVVGCSLLAAVFVPFGLDLGPVVGFVLYVVKVLALVAVLSLARTIFARLRIDQMLDFCWRIVAPVAFVQMVIVLVAKGLVK